MSEKLEIMLTIRALVKDGQGQSSYANELRKRLAELKADKCESK
jgi:hypothetical protein